MYSRFHNISLFLVLAFPFTAFTQSGKLSFDATGTLNDWYKNAVTVQGGAWMLPSDSMNVVTLLYDYKSGGLRKSQEARTQRDITVETYGWQPLNKLLLSGYFGYARHLHDSVSWSLAPREPLTAEGNPYYYASRKAGNWDDEQYQIGGNLMLPLHQNWMAGGGVRYKAGAGARSNDPRPQMNNHQVDFSAGVGYKRNAFKIHLDASYGYGSAEQGVTYSNDDDNNTPAAVDYIVYDFLGYGFYRYRAALRMEQRVKLWRTGIQLSMPMAGGTMFHQVRYSRQTDSSFRETTGASGVIFDELGMYTLNAFQGNHRWIKRGLMAFLLWDMKTGEDFNKVLLNGFNYRYSRKQAAFGVRFQHKSGYVSGWLFQGQTGFSQQQWQDGNTQHDAMDAAVTVDFSASKRFPVREKNGWEVYGTFGARVNTLSYLNAPPSQINLFTQAVAYPNAQYAQTDQFKTGTAVTYIHQLLPGKYMRCSLFANCDNALNGYDAPLNKADPFVPSGRRLHAGARLQFLF